MNIRPIKTEADYDAALIVIEELMGAAPDTPEGDELAILVTLVEAYEAEHWPIEAPDPISAIEHVMEVRGMYQKDFAALIGSQPHASEVLNRQRPLTLPMIRVLSAEWDLPADILVREYDLTNHRVAEKIRYSCSAVENGGDKLVHGSGGISQPRAE